METTIQETFDPIDFGFKWTDDWYEFDYIPAHTAARYARSKRVAELKKLGYDVKVSTDGRQLRKLGGIGTSHPEIHEVVSIYRLTATLRRSCALLYRWATVCTSIMVTAGGMGRSLVPR